MIKIDEYEVNPVSVGDMMPILPLATSDSAEFQFKLVSVSVTKNGAKLTEDDVRKLPFSLYMKKLIPAVVEVNGLGDSGNE